MEVACVIPILSRSEGVRVARVAAARSGVPGVRLARPATALDLWPRPTMRWYSTRRAGAPDSGRIFH